MFVAALISTALALVSFIVVIITGYTLGLVVMFLLVAVAASLLVIDISAKRHPTGRHAAGEQTGEDH
ncbi:hypothetical protein [Corynebacterium lowii]|uniref:Uncharacterized protein n=1 Tax=Corynebacterium lowii TaxID=1544413 RepID=A0A0Q0UFE0_9CORY|nr:hypothetical protein [Corynebacterium lowii]KQB86748.1 hypothetical protein Clow_00956 [Corynebacterium lowii]MDP9851434.1 archaellum biogenesis protein FlaJ (TadC family) [Corynebacterium lowii]